MNKFGFLLGMLLASFPSMMFGQMEKSIKLNEVMTDNTANMQDEYGQCGPWIELVNASHTTYNIRGMYITTDKSVLDPKMSVPERIKRMSIIPNGEARTNLSGGQHLLLFCNSQPAKGALHITAKVDSAKSTWIGLYNGNAVDLIDSVTVPALGTNMSLARHNDGVGAWEVKAPDAVTPGISNYIKVSESKVAKIKREDPHGFGLSVLAMSIVFFCLALLWVFFTLFGIFMRNRHTVKKAAGIQPLKAGVKTVEKTLEVANKTSTILQDGLKLKGIDKEVYIAVIAMAIKQYEDDVHDVESGIITIKPKKTEWNTEYIQMTQFHE